MSIKPPQHLFGFGSEVFSLDQLLNSDDVPLNDGFYIVLFELERFPELGSTSFSSKNSGSIAGKRKRSSFSDKLANFLYGLSDKSLSKGSFFHDIQYHYGSSSNGITYGFNISS